MKQFQQEVDRLKIKAARLKFHNQSQMIVSEDEYVALSVSDMLDFVFHDCSTAPVPTFHGMEIIKDKPA